MSIFKPKSKNKFIENMIKDRKRMNIRYLDVPGFEGTDQALLLAQIKVYEGILNLNSPEWAIRGDNHFRKYLKKFKLKVPSYDFEWLETNLSNFWDSFRFVMLEPENSGAFEPKVLDDLRTEFLKVFDAMPKRFRYTRRAEHEAIDLMLVSLQLCLASDNQLLANPVFEIVLLLWYHNLYALGELKD